MSGSKTGKGPGASNSTQTDKSKIDTKKKLEKEASKKDKK